MNADAEEEGELAALRVCSDVQEAVYLLTKRDAVRFDHAMLAWKCAVPLMAPICTRFGEVTCSVMRSHDGTLVCSHPSGTVYLHGLSIVEDTEGSFVDVGLLPPAERAGVVSLDDEPPAASGKWNRSRLAKVDTLDLRGCGVDRGVVMQLSRGLSSNRFVKMLSLSGNQLQDSDVVLLADALVHDACLQDLTLSYNAIAELGSTLLAKALATNKRLRTLDLTHNHIGKGGIQPWLGPTMRANHALRELKLSHNAIGDAKAVELLESLAPKALTKEEQLKALIATRRRVSMPVKMATVSDDEPFNSTLTTLLLSNTGISDEASPHLAHTLARTQTLTHLDLSCNDFTSAGNLAIAHGLQQNGTIRLLNYRENKLDEGAAVALVRALTTHSFVETALFQDCFPREPSVGSSLGQLMRATRTLATLDLSHCPLEPPGVVEFYQALGESTTLRSVDLTCSGLKLDSVAGILAKALQKNTTLGFLNLSYNELTLHGCKLLRDAVAARGEGAVRLTLSLEGNSGEKCPLGTVITGGMRPARPPLIY